MNLFFKILKVIFILLSLSLTCTLKNYVKWVLGKGLIKLNFENKHMQYNISLPVKIIVPLLV